MARPEKVSVVESLQDVFKDARCVVLNDYTGLDVAKLTLLRCKCRENGVEYRVIKNTLAKRSLKETPAEELESFFEGPTALAISRESENLSAKILAEFAKEHEAPRFKAAIVEGQILEAADVDRLAKLPSREVLLSQVLAGIQGPGNGLVSVLQGTLRQFMNVMDAIKSKLQSEGGGEPQKSE
ncbi:MAG: 50S ribosomal protein L10 [Candidatus Latescibacterota bacterium]